MSVRHRLLLPAAAVLFGLTACASTPPAAPTAAAPTTSAAPVSAVPVPASDAPSPTPAATSATARSAAAPATSRAESKPVQRISCPSAKTLEGLTDLPAGWHFVPSSVECWKGWATADPKGPGQGDGFYLFHYKPGTGWRYDSQGSGYDCKDLGIKEEAPFCQYP